MFQEQRGRKFCSVYWTNFSASGHSSKTQVGFPRIFLLSKHGTWNKSSYPNSLVSRMIPVKVSGSSQIFERMTFLCSMFQVLGGGLGKSRAIFSWSPPPEKKFIESLGRVLFQVCSWNSRLFHVPGFGRGFWQKSGIFFPGPPPPKKNSSKVSVEFCSRSVPGTDRPRVLNP